MVVAEAPRAGASQLASAASRLQQLLRRGGRLDAVRIQLGQLGPHGGQHHQVAFSQRLSIAGDTPGTSAEGCPPTAPGPRPAGTG